MTTFYITVEKFYEVEARTEDEALEKFEKEENTDKYFVEEDVRIEE